MSNVSLVVNGRKVSATVEDRTLLVHFIRENLGLTGTHVGCDTSQCGACVIHVDGKAVKSCTMLAAQASGSEIVTIEGLADGADLHPVQAAFREHHGLQCGFCTPGMIMAATDMISRHPEGLDEATVRARTRRQHLPLHRISQHRQGDTGGFASDVEAFEGQGEGGLRISWREQKFAIGPHATSSFRQRFQRLSALDDRSDAVFCSHHGSGGEF